MLTLLAVLSLLHGPGWTLTRITPADQEGFTLGPRLTPPRLRVGRATAAGLTVTGTTGCSPLKGHATLSGAAVHFTALDAGSSERCPDHALSLREDFVRLLSGASRYEVRGDTLTLSGAAGQLTFRAAPVEPARRDAKAAVLCGRLAT